MNSLFNAEKVQKNKRKKLPLHLKKLSTLVSLLTSRYD
jgi:hypothetical protein